MISARAALRCMVGRHRRHDDASDLLGGLDQVRIGKMGIARRCAVPPMPEQLADQRKVFTGHDGSAGRGVPKAKRSRPAEQGHAVAQHNLKFMYENGAGVQASLVKAYAWYSVAAS